MRLSLLAVCRHRVVGCDQESCEKGSVRTKSNDSLHALGLLLIQGARVRSSISQLYSATTVASSDVLCSYYTRRTRCATTVYVCAAFKPRCLSSAQSPRFGIVTQYHAFTCSLGPKFLFCGAYSYRQRGQSFYESVLISPPRKKRRKGPFPTIIASLLSTPIIRYYGTGSTASFSHCQIIRFHTLDPLCSNRDPTVGKST